MERLHQAGDSLMSEDPNRPLTGLFVSFLLAYVACAGFAASVSLFFAVLVTWGFAFILAVFIATTTFACVVMKVCPCFSSRGDG